MKFEQLLEELNKIVKALEVGNLSLDESIKYYERGKELSLLCRKQLIEAKEVVLKKMGDAETKGSI